MSHIYFIFSENLNNEKDVLLHLFSPSTLHISIDLQTVKYFCFIKNILNSLVLGREMGKGNNNKIICNNIKMDSQFGIKKRVRLTGE